jgi:histone acetyltransferase (RNA polymerase elongator complex component)
MDVVKLDSRNMGVKDEEQELWTEQNVHVMREAKAKLKRAVVLNNNNKKISVCLLGGTNTTAVNQIYDRWFVHKVLKLNAGM